MTNAIEIRGLTKKYKDFTLGGITEDIPCGFASALIGANGAGKTTLIDTLCGVTAKTSGDALYFGSKTDTDDPELRNMIGYCSSANLFPQDWRLKTIAEASELAFDNFDRERYTKLCKRLKLGDPADKGQKKLYKMSDGNKMRAYLAAVLARDTRLLVLDEPASSLDPLARDLLCELFREYLTERDGERTVLFSTHNIADMEFATDYAIFMANGKTVERGFVEDLKEKYILVHGDAKDVSRAKPHLLSCVSNRTSFEGIAYAGSAETLEGFDCAVETPTLQQLSVGILRKAEEDGEDNDNYGGKG
ncbi:MAG: ABC transporter ATP-binding protein [Ruminococcus sp.]|nr:ABC transporter ATP-binding protein [Ruminococcus sp.]